MERTIHELPTRRIIYRALDMADELNIANILNDADSDRQVAFEISSIFALAALVSLNNISKEDAIAGFSNLLDEVHALEIVPIEQPEPEQ